MKWIFIRMAIISCDITNRLEKRKKNQLKTVWNEIWTKQTVVDCTNSSLKWIWWSDELKKKKNSKTIQIDRKNKIRQKKRKKKKTYVFNDVIKNDAEANNNYCIQYCNANELNRLSYGHRAQIIRANDTNDW